MLDPKCVSCLPLILRWCSYWAEACRASSGLLNPGSSVAWGKQSRNAVPSWESVSALRKCTFSLKRQNRTRGLFKVLCLAQWRLFGDSCCFNAGLARWLTWVFSPMRSKRQFWRCCSEMQSWRDLKRTGLGKNCKRFHATWNCWLAHRAFQRRHQGFHLSSVCPPSKFCCASSHCGRGSNAEVTKLWWRARTSFATPALFRPCPELKLFESHVVCGSWKL